MKKYFRMTKITKVKYVYEKLLYNRGNSKRCLNNRIAKIVCITEIFRTVFLVKAIYLNRKKKE